MNVRTLPGGLCSSGQNIVLLMESPGGTGRSILYSSVEEMFLWLPAWSQPFLNQLLPLLAADVENVSVKTKYVVQVHLPATSNIIHLNTLNCTIPSSEFLDQQ